VTDRDGASIGAAAFALSFASAIAYFALSEGIANFVQFLAAAVARFAHMAG
jgi:hypothetical protein